MHHLYNHQTIKLSKETLGSGGEGQVFEVESPAEYRNYVAKIYHPQERKPERIEKLNYLINHKLNLSDKYAFIFPEEILYEDGTFVGYLMLRARGEYDLTVLSSLTLPLKLEEDWIEKYRRDKPENIRNYQKIAKNLALAFADFYTQNEYILTDLKPENIKVNLKGQVSVIDLDSLQIQKEGKVLFPAEKISQEYSPPEREIFKEGEMLEASWTYFSLSVILYKLLLGLHPFTVTGKGDLSKLATLSDKIKFGLFPFGQKSAMIEVIPTPHQNFNILPSSVQKLFIQSLDTFSEHPSSRPNATQWIEGLENKSLVLREYVNPLAKKQTDALSKRDEYLFLEPIKYRDYNKVVWGMGVSVALLNLFSLFDLLEIRSIFFTILSMSIIFTFVGSLSLFQINNFSINLQTQELWILRKNLFGVERIKKIPLRNLTVVLKEVLAYKPRVILEIRKKNILGFETTILTIRCGKNSKKSKNREIIKTMLREFKKYNITIETEEIDVDEFLREV
jgi:serine/threonine protein kinase